MKKQMLFVVLCLVFFAGCLGTSDPVIMPPNDWRETQMEGEIPLPEGETANEGEGESLPDGESEGEVIIITEGEGETTSEGETANEGEGELPTEGEGEGEPFNLPMSNVDAWEELTGNPFIVSANDGNFDLGPTGDFNGNGIAEFAHFELLDRVLSDESAPGHQAVSDAYSHNYLAAKAITDAMSGNSDGSWFLLIDPSVINVAAAGFMTIAEQEDIKAIDLLAKNLFPYWKLFDEAYELIDRYDFSVNLFDFSAGNLLKAAADLDGDSVSNADEYYHNEVALYGIHSLAETATDSSRHDFTERPKINYAVVPSYGSDGLLSGTVSGVNPSDYGVVTFITAGNSLVSEAEASGTYFSRPFPENLDLSNDDPVGVLTPINEDGTWSQEIVLHPADAYSIKLVSALVPLAVSDLSLCYLTGCGALPEIPEAVAWTSFIRDPQGTALPEFYHLTVARSYSYYGGDGVGIATDISNPTYCWVINPNIMGGEWYPSGSQVHLDVLSDYRPYFMNWNLSDLGSSNLPTTAITLAGDLEVIAMFAELQLLELWGYNEGETEGEPLSEGEGEVVVEGEPLSEGEGEPIGVSQPTIFFGCPDANRRLTVRLEIPEGHEFGEYLYPPSVTEEMISLIGVAGPNGNWVVWDEVNGYLWDHWGESNPDVVAYGGDLSTLGLSTSLEPEAWSPTPHFRGAVFLVTDDGYQHFLDMDVWTVATDFAIGESWRDGEVIDFFPGACND